MSLDSIKLPFLRIRDLPDKFQVAVTGNSIEKTRFTKEGEEGQRVIKVLQETEKGVFPLKGSPPTHFLAMSNTAQSSLVAKGYRHLNDLTDRLVTFKKVTVGGFAQQTIEVVKVEAW